jgi:hypothetical protein
MTRSGRTVLAVDVEVLADLVVDALNDLVDDDLLAGRVGLLVSPSPPVRGAFLHRAAEYVVGADVDPAAYGWVAGGGGGLIGPLLARAARKEVFTRD